MISSISIRHFHSGLVTMTTITDDSKVTQQKLQTVWDMSEIPVPKKRFKLPARENYLFTKVLFSPEGKEVLHELKNERADIVINTFLEGYKKNLSYPIKNEGCKKKYSLVEFVNGVIKEPLVGRNRINPVSIGITKKEIFDRFVEKGLIKIS